MAGNRGEESAHAGLTIRLFGCPEYWRGHEMLPPLATRKAQSLLAYLILHRHRAHSRDLLATLFWGDRDDAHARRSLATALWHIRRLLGEGYLLAETDAVQFNPASSFWLDVAEFEKRVTSYTREQSASPEPLPIHLAAAVDLYRGDLLEGFYDDWCIEERYRLEGLYINALSRLVAWHEAHGDAQATLAYAQRYLARDPLAESVHLAAMRALASLGDLVGARRQWQACCESRQQELHLPPSPETIKEAERILGASFIIPLPVEAQTTRGLTPSGDLERPPFVGRARELRGLEARWAEAAHGHGGIVFISGEAGIGKTRLTEEFAAMVRGRGGVVGYGRCYEPERVLPYQPLADVLRDLAAQRGDAAPALPAWVRGEVARLAPERMAPLIPPEPLPDPLQAERQAVLFHAIAAFVRHYASLSPLLIVLEDLHWATDSTLAAVHYLVRQTADAPLLLLGTLRTEEVAEAHPLAAMAGRLARDGLAQHLMLERLSAQAVAELLRRTSGAEPEAELVDRLYAHTEGNAFFLVETLRELAGTPIPGLSREREEGAGCGLPVPGNVRALLEWRLGRLSAPARAWLVCAAVAGRTFDLDVVCRAMGADEDAALEALDDLLKQGFLREGSGILGRDYEFVHHLVQEATYSAIHHRRRRRLHRLIGAAMESLYADRAAIAGALAHHFDAGGEAESALHYHGAAAREAAAVFAWHEAERHYTRMLELLEQLDPRCTHAECVGRRGQVLTARAQLRFLQARLAERDADLAALAALAETSSDDRLRVQALIHRARYLNLDAQYGEAIAVAEKGLALSEAQPDAAARCHLLTQIGFAHYFLGQPQPALAALESALDMVQEADRETRRHITHILGYVHFHLGNYARSLAYGQESYEDHRAFADYNGMAWAGLDMGAVYREMGQLTEAGQYLTEHLDLARRVGARSAEAYGLIQLGAWELCRGNYVTAADLFQQAVVAQQALRTEHGRVAAELGTGFALYHLGDLDEARHWLTQAVERARPIRHRRRLAEALIGLGLTEISAGRPLVARDCLTEAVAVARDSECKGNLAAGLAALARAERHLGGLAQALARACEAVRVAREVGSLECEMWSEMEVGLALVARGEPEAALEHTGRAASLGPGGESWIGTEQVHQAHARVLRSLGRTQEAREQERTAEAIIDAKADRIPDPQQRRRFLQAGE